MDFGVVGTGLVIGLMGSVHCVGMCGPLALALPVPTHGPLLLGRLLYNLGRALTYAALGGILGALGHVVAGLAGAQRAISITAGVAILVFVAFRHRVTAVPAPFRGLYEIVKESLGRRLARGTWSSLLGIGLLNGLLPCGLVWVGLAAAVASGGPVEGALLMFAFGLGTLPLMLATSLAGGVMSQRLRLGLGRAVPVVLVVMGLWFVLRGLGLGIPFLSPDVAASGHQH